MACNYTHDLCDHEDAGKKKSLEVCTADRTECKIANAQKFR